MSNTQKHENDKWRHRTKKPITPLKAKAILHRLGLSQNDLRKYIVLPNGAHPSEPTIGHILNRNIWPSRIPESMLKQQLLSFLRHHKADEEEVKVALEIDDDEFIPRSTRQDRAPYEQVAVSPFDEKNQLPENEMLTQTARKHFQLFRDPFQDDVQSSEDVFLAPDQRYIREYMFTTAKQGGFLAVIGESGAGKTVLRRDLIDRIYQEGHEITPIMPRIIDKERLTAGAICDSIIEDMSQETPRQTLEAKGRQIERLLIGSSRGGSSHVLIIEEAHDLSIPVLKYLKRFWELEDGFKRLLSIILIGQPELKAKLDERQNWQAREVIRRIEVAELAPLNGNLKDYLDLKFQRVNRKVEDIFQDDAYDAIRDRLTLRSRSSREPVSMLYPLVVNNMAVKCMNLAAEVGVSHVDAEVVRGV
jgi:type II secretory pathway predicted ATPase ExeA